jgi:hypothetical protein
VVISLDLWIAILVNPFAVIFLSLLVAILVHPFVAIFVLIFLNLLVVILLLSHFPYSIIYIYLLLDPSIAILQFI